MTRAQDPSNAGPLSNGQGNRSFRGFVGALDVLRSRARNRFDRVQQRGGDHARRETSALQPNTEFVVPAWQGQYEEDATLIIDDEQWVQDEILFAAYLPALLTRAQASGMRILIACEPSLQRLFKSSFTRAVILTRDGVTEQVVAARKFAAKIWRLPISELALWIPKPAMAAYLRPHPDDLALMCHFLSSYPVRHDAVDGPRIGFAWNHAIQVDAPRWLPGNEALQLLDVLTARLSGSYFNLKLSDQASESTPMSGFRITDLGDLLGDFSKVAALMQEMDVVVATCADTANLAGALGLGAHILLPKEQDWRWSPSEGWYPKIRCYSQVTQGDWTEPLIQLFGKLPGCSRGSA
jgi:hypothetical protein